jgi:hypothetical protein
VHKEIVETYPKETLAVYVVWLPMIQSDNEVAARNSSTMYTDPRLRQYYDPDRMTGIAFSKEVKPEQFNQLLASMAADHPLKQRMTEWFSMPPENRPAWDIVYLFPPGVRWTESLPTPSFWTKQMGFFGDQPGDAPSGVFFRHDSREPPVQSDWFVEVREAMKEAALSRRAGSKGQP